MTKIKLKYIIKEEIKNSLLEKMLSQYNSDNVVTSDYIENELLNSDANERLFDQYKYENNINDKIDFDEFSDDAEKLLDFSNWLKYEFEYKFNEQKELYKNIFRENGGKMILFRRMKVSKEWIKSLLKNNTELGIYWSYEKDAAEAHWGYSKEGTSETALLQTSVFENQVNWKETFFANLDPILGEDEKEVRLNKYEEIKLESLWINERKINLNKVIKSNTYLS